MACKVEFEGETFDVKAHFCWDGLVFINCLFMLRLKQLLFLSVSINNKLQQPQAAHGVLVYAMKNHGADVVSS